jgi:hypothetical protein
VTAQQQPKCQNPSSRSVRRQTRKMVPPAAVLCIFIAVAVAARTSAGVLVVIGAASVLCVAARWVSWRVGANQPPLTTISVWETVKSLADETTALPFLLRVTRVAEGAVRIRWPHMVPFVVITEPEAMKLIMTHPTSEKPLYVLSPPNPKP